MRKGGTTQIYTACMKALRTKAEGQELRGSEAKEAPVRQSHMRAPDATVRNGLGVSMMPSTGISKSSRV